MKAVFWVSIVLFLVAFVLLGVGANEKIDLWLGWDQQVNWEAGRVTAFLIILASAALVIAFVTGLLRLVGAGITFMINTMPMRAARAPAEGEGAPMRVTTTPLDAIVSLAIVVICFPTFAGVVYIATVELFGATIVWMPQNIIQSAFSIQGCEEIMGGSCLSLYLEAIIRPLMTSAGELLSLPSVQDLPVRTLLIALAFWAILIYAIASARQPKSWWLTMSGTRKRAGAYLILAVFSSYVAISALLAFALFDRDQDQDVASEGELNQRVTSFTENLWNIYGWKPETPDQTQPTGDRLRRQNETPSEEQKSTELELVSQEQFEYRVAKASYEESRKLPAEARARNNEFFRSLVAQITQVFKSRSRGRLGQRELSDHEARLLSWFAAEAEKARIQLSECGAYIDRMRLKLAELEERARMKPPAKPTESGKSREPAQIYIPDPPDPFSSFTERSSFSSSSEQTDPYLSFQSELRAAQSKCTTPLKPDNRIPTRDSYGKSLGPVAVWTSWLLSGESKQVSLIIGLIGFGLLGATASNYFRPVKTGPNGEDEDGGAAASVYEISSVFVKGFVAAIVVYLTATGGLAIVGDQGGGTPNPYVVFAACLVGAVFSEEVWARAKKKFFPEEGENGADPAENGATVETPEPEQPPAAEPVIVAESGDQPPPDAPPEDRA